MGGQHGPQRQHCRYPQCALPMFLWLSEVQPSSWVSVQALTFPGLCNLMSLEWSWAEL